MFTSSIIAILTISRAIIQSCMGGSIWFAKGTELSWITNYCISLIEIQSKLKTLSRSQAIVYRRTHRRTMDTMPKQFFTQHFISWYSQTIFYEHIIERFQMLSKINHLNNSSLERANSLLLLMCQMLSVWVKG